MKQLSPYIQNTTGPHSKSYSKWMFLELHNKCILEKNVLAQEPSSAGRALGQNVHSKNKFIVLILSSLQILQTQYGTFTKYSQSCTCNHNKANSDKLHIPPPKSAVI